MIRSGMAGLLLALGSLGAAHAAGPDCTRPYTLALHDHGLLYSAATDSGIDKDFADELARRSGCQIRVSLMSRARIWALIRSGALDFSLSGIASDERNRYADFAWYFSDRYFLLVRTDSGVRTAAGFERAARLQLGVIRSFRYSASANHLVDTLAEDNRVTQASGLEPLYDALVARQIQGMIIEPFDYPAIGAKRIRDVTTVVPFDDPAVPHGLIMSKKALSPAQRAQWRALVDQMRADGTVLRLFEKYFDPALAASMVDFQAAQ